MSLEKVKELSSKTIEFEKGYDAIVSVASSDIASNAMKILVYLFIGIGWLFLKKQLVKKQIELSSKLSAEEQAELKKYLNSVNENQADKKITDLESGF